LKDANPGLTNLEGVISGAKNCIDSWAQMSGGSNGGCDGCYEETDNSGKTVFVKPDKTRFLAKQGDVWACFGYHRWGNIPGSGGWYVKSNGPAKYPWIASWSGNVKVEHRVKCEDCNCPTVTLSLSGSANAELSFLAGNYQEDIMINGHQSWNNTDYAIWFSNVSNEWVVGRVGWRGTNRRWMEANNQGSKCPFDITADWYLYYSSQWNLVAGASFTCSQPKNDYVPCPAKNQNLKGKDIHQQVTGSWNECGLLCYKYPSCKYWTWIENYKGWAQYCNLKDANPGLTNLEGVISGAKNCIDSWAQMSGGSNGGCDGCYEETDNSGKTVFVKPDKTRFLAKQGDVWACFGYHRWGNIPGSGGWYVKSNGPAKYPWIASWSGNVKVEHKPKCEDDDVPCPAKNQDIYGKDIHTQVVGSWKECGMLCYKYPSCKYWTWIENYKGWPHTCHLKNANPGLTNLEGVISGDKNCIAPPGGPGVGFEQTTCPTPSTYQGLDPERLFLKYYHVDCDGDGILDHCLRDFSKDTRQCVLSTEGCPNSWGTKKRKKTECVPAFLHERKEKQALPNNFLGHCPTYYPNEKKPINGKCCFETDCCWDRCTKNPPPMDAFEYIPGGKWILIEGESSVYRAYSELPIRNLDTPKGYSDSGDCYKGTEMIDNTCCCESSNGECCWNKCKDEEDLGGIIWLGEYWDPIKSYPNCLPKGAKWYFDTSKNYYRAGFF